MGAREMLVIAYMGSGTSGIYIDCKLRLPKIKKGK